MKITFHGGVEEVTGSCHLLTVLDDQKLEHQFLIDCGMIQGEQMCSTRNLDAFGFDASKIEAVFVTHPHADHTGRLPVLVKEGFRGKIYMTEPCLALTKLVLEDAFHIMKEDAEKCGSSILYTLGDLTEVFSLAEPVSYHQALTLAPGIIATFHDAGHVLGSAYVSFDAQDKRVVFSGDIGNDHVPILPPTDQLSRANVVVCESTYGDRVHEDAATRSALLREAMEEVIKQKGVLLIPAFSIERTQELLYEIDLILKTLETNMPIFLDSPMAIKATQVYRDFKQFLRFDAPISQEPDRDFFSFPNLRETLTVDASKQINDIPSPKIIIAGSGMMSGGRIMHHLKGYLPFASTTILVIGYQAAGTIGRKIFDGAKSVRVFGEEVDVHAKIKGIGAFSAHGDQTKLTNWLTPENGVMPEKIYLVHGDPEVKITFAEHLRKELKTDVVIPEMNATVDV